MINWSKVIEILLAPTAGLFGGISVLRYHDDVKRAWDISIFLFTSVCCATFITPLFSDPLNLGTAASGGVGYLLGCFGGSAITAIIRWLRTVDITDLLQKLKWW